MNYKVRKVYQSTFNIVYELPSSVRRLHTACVSQESLISQTSQAIKDKANSSTYRTLEQMPICLMAIKKFWMFDLLIWLIALSVEVPL